MFKKLFTAAWTALLLACCQLAAAAPTVNVTATPSNPTVPATVTLAVTATSDGNPVMATQVEYFNGSTSLGASVQAPFTLTLDNLAAGTYQIIAKVATTDPANPILQSAPLAVTVATPPGTATAYFIHTDQLNTPRAITNGGGNLVWQWDSDPFGKDAANEQPAGQPVFTFNQRFPGQQFDRESNLHYNYFRDYDPQIGRYLQSDPIGLRGGINTYGYVKGNSLSYVDPLGLQQGYPGESPAPKAPIGLPNPSAEAQRDLALRLTRATNWFAQKVKDICSPAKPTPEECKKQWDDARKFCDRLYDSGYLPDKNGKGAGGMNWNQCVAGQVTEDCGGNPIE
ncbi:RHS repeat-associated core domain-containing protein [Duganella sp. Root336D2]|uniref:RHS repeat-associated core domain-containing protein n=1 Tax=Duganella sp. Root336D2 TaxID=1736518 RepID=UPI0026F42275|nr:RHS repeat-associated core domain-containing protein [Duganella sp. Root336D2]